MEQNRLKENSGDIEILTLKVDPEGAVWLAEHEEQVTHVVVHYTNRTAIFAICLSILAASQLKGVLHELNFTDRFADFIRRHFKEAFPDIPTKSLDIILSFALQQLVEVRNKHQKEFDGLFQQFGIQLTRTEYIEGKMSKEQ